MDQNFVPIRLSTLRSSHDFDFDIYIKVADKFVKYINNGDDIQKERLQSLKEKKVRKLFIEDNDESKYQAFLDRALFDASEDSSLDSEEKADMAQGVAANAAENMMENHSSKAAFEETENASKGLIEIIKKNPGILESLYKKALESESDPIIKHSIGVAFLSLTMVQKLGFDDKTAENMGVAGLLHDIGRVVMQKDDSVLFRMEYSEMSPEQFKRYKEHPSLGYDLLDRKDYVNKPILDFVLTHEENMAGTGFPKGIKKMTPAQELFSLCCCYDRLVTLLGKTKEEAFETLKVDFLGNYDLKLINKFKAMIKESNLV